MALLAGEAGEESEWEGARVKVTISVIMLAEAGVLVGMEGRELVGWRGDGEGWKRGGCGDWRMFCFGDADERFCCGEKIMRRRECGPWEHGLV